MQNAKADNKWRQGLWCGFMGVGCCSCLSIKVNAKIPRMMGFIGAEASCGGFGTLSMRVH